jgi:hypothetical protein
MRDGGKTSNAVQTLSKRLGDSRQLILRNLVAYKIFEQARDLGYIEERWLEENPLDFSHLYTMLQSPAARSYLGLTEAPLSETQVIGQPIPDTHHDKLRNVISWLFGGPGVDPVIRQQGTDRPKLIKVLASAAATETLELTGDFDRAVEEAGFGVEDWFGSTVRLEALSKRVSDGVSDLPTDTEVDLLGKALARISASGRNIEAATTLLQRFFKGVKERPPSRSGLRPDSWRE